MSLAIFFSFYGKVSGAGLTHASQICPCLELSFPDSSFYKSPYSITYFHYFLIYRYPASLFPLDKMYTRFVACITPLRSTVNFPKSNCSIKNAHHNTQLLLSHFFSIRNFLILSPNVVISIHLSPMSFVRGSFSNHNKSISLCK